MAPPSSNSRRIFLLGGTLVLAQLLMLTPIEEWWTRAPAAIYSSAFRSSLLTTAAPGSLPLRLPLIVEWLFAILLILVVIKPQRTVSLPPLPWPSPNAQRVFALSVVVLLGYVFVFWPVQEWWTNYWLLRDCEQGLAVVTLEKEHGQVAYQYFVSGRAYTGSDYRSLEDATYANVIVGGHTVVHYSRSHPWLSRIDKPRSSLPVGLPLLIFVWLVEIRAVLAVIKPGSKWALKFIGKNAFRVGRDDELSPSQYS